MAADGLFHSFIREHLHLSNYLWGRREVQMLHERARRAKSDVELDDLRGSQLLRSVHSLKLASPKIGPLLHGDVRQDGGQDRKLTIGVRVPTTRHYFRLNITGDAEVLRHWPDDAATELRAIDDDVLDRIGGPSNLTQASDEDLDEYWRVKSTWTLATLDGGDDRWALYTYVDLTADEEARYAIDVSDLSELLARRVALVTPIVEAVASQVDKFFDSDLPSSVSSVVDSRARVLTDRAAIVRNLDLPSEWVADPPVVEAEPRPGAQPGTEGSRDSARQGEPVALELAPQYRLSEKSFGEVLHTIRVWADAVEQYPRGFGSLDEDAISDLLAATLNATVPHAAREVYSRSGRTDIFIKADVLHAGAGPAKVFICETKWATGRSAIVDALGVQLFRYASAHMTSAVLLALCRQEDFEQARQRVVKWATEASGWTGEQSASVVTGWPILTYSIEGRIIKVCVVTVAVPKVKTREGRPK